MTSAQVIFDYLSLMDATESQILLVKDSYLEGISQSFWDLNEEAIETQFDGILNIPGISYIEAVNPATESKWFRGTKPTQYIHRSFDMNYEGLSGEETHLGKLHIYADKQYVYDQITNKVILILTTQFIKTLGVSLLILWFIRLILTKPLVEIRNHLSTFSLHSIKERKLLIQRFSIIKSRQDEVDELITTINSMEDSLYQKTNSIREFQQSLMDMVDDKTKEIRAILTSIQQGVFIIDLNGKVLKDYSIFLKKILEQDRIEGLNFYTDILNNFDLNDDQKEHISCLLQTTLGSDIINFQLNRHHFPNQLTMISGETRKEIEIDWAPMTENKTICKILICLRDVTAICEAEKKINIRDELISRIDKLVHLDDRTFSYFLTKLNAFCLKISALNLDDDSSELKYSLFLDAHTLKSRSRSFKLEDLCESLHQIEDFLSINAERKDIAIFQKHVQRLQKDTDEYDLIWNEKLNRSKLPFNIKTTDLVDFIEELEPLKSHLSEETLQITESFKKFCYRPIQDICYEGLRGYHINSTAHQDMIPEIELQTDDIGLTDNIAQVTISMLSHLLSNTMEHGYNEQTNNIKIKLNFILEENQLFFTYSDSGAGIDLKKLREKCSNTNIDTRDTPQALMNCLLLPEFSTKTQVSMKSGRGIGLASIHDTINQLKGSVELKPTVESESWQPFVINIKVPAKGNVCSYSSQRICSHMTQRFSKQN